jgi:transcriptional regulator with XRE-family HTH domain
MSTPPQGYQRQIHTPGELGSVISELRSHRRKTQFEVASALAIDRSQLAHLEGGRSGRYLAHLLNILDHLGAELQVHWPSEAADQQPGQPANQPAHQGAPSRLDPSFALSSSVFADSTLRSGSTLPSATAPMPGPASPVSSVSSVSPVTPASAANPVTSVTGVATGAPGNPDVRPGALSLDEIYRPDGPNTSNDDGPDQHSTEAPAASAERTAQPPTELTTESTVESTVDALPEAKANEEESTSTQLTKITNLAMNVMAASQQLSGQPRSPR